MEYDYKYTEAGNCKKHVKQYNDCRQNKVYIAYTADYCQRSEKNIFDISIYLKELDARTNILLNIAVKTHKNNQCQCEHRNKRLY